MVEEIIALLRACPDTPSGRRTKALIIVLWRSGLRISEALALEEHDLDATAGSITVRCGKGGKRRIVGMDRWAWAQIVPWLTERLDYPRGPVFCVVEGSTIGRQLSASAARATLRPLAKRAGIRRRIAPHQLRHCHAVELVREGVPVHILQRQLGHANLAVTTVYLASVSPRKSSPRPIADKRRPWASAISSSRDAASASKRKSAASRSQVGDRPDRNEEERRAINRPTRTDQRSESACSSHDYERRVTNLRQSMLTAEAYGASAPVGAASALASKREPWSGIRERG